MATDEQTAAAHAVEAAVQELNSALRVANRVGVQVRLETMEMQEFGKEAMKIVTANCLIEVGRA